MAKITMSHARQIANKISGNKFDEKIKQINTKLIDAATKLARKEIPKDVLQLFEKDENFKKYIITSGNVVLFGNGWNGESVSIKYLPHYNQYSALRISPDQKSADAIRKIWDEKHNLQKKQKELRDSLYRAFIQLGTDNRIKEQFPELEEYFPTNQKMAIAVQFEDVKELLNEKVK